MCMIVCDEYIFCYFLSTLVSIYGIGLSYFWFTFTLDTFRVIYQTFFFFVCFSRNLFFSKDLICIIIW